MVAKRKMVALVVVIALIIQVVMMSAVYVGAQTGMNQIRTVEQLNDIRNDLTGNYCLGNDIVIDNSCYAAGGIFEGGFVPIAGDGITPFRGTIDGNGYSIINLKIDLELTNSVYAGFVGYNAGTIKNLALVNCEIKAHSKEAYAMAGAVAALSSGTIENCYSTGSIFSQGDEDNAYAGGIAARTGKKAVVLNCYSIASTTASTLITSKNDGWLDGWYDSNGKVDLGDIGMVFAYNGAVIGYSLGSANNCYYLSSSNTAGVGNEAKPGVRALSEAQMSDESSFIGFDFDSRWHFSDGEYTYPTLIEYFVSALEIKPQYPQIKTNGSNLIVFTDSVTAEKTGADFKSFFDNSNIILKKSDGNALSDSELVGSGCTLTVGATDENYTIVVIGDIDGNGEINSKDITGIKRVRAGKKTLDKAYLLAAHTYSELEDDIATKDVTKMMKYISGKINGFFE